LSLLFTHRGEERVVGVIDLIWLLCAYDCFIFRVLLEHTLH